jgi:hypothetical protein
MTHKCDGIARVFDFVFVGGFATLAVLYIILRMIPGKDTSTADFVLVGYYIFFSLFMLFAVLRNETLIRNCGFLDNVLLKSVFYIL